MTYLAVIDMQKDFIDGALGTPEAVGIVDAVCALIEEHKARGSKIFVTLDTHQPDYLTTQEGKNLPVEHCIKGTDGWLLNEQVARAIGGECEPFEKPTFGSTALAERIRELYQEGDELEICGLCTDICVVSNALLIKAACPELPITLRPECCAGVTPEKHEAALETMRSCQVGVRDKM